MMQAGRYYIGDLCYVMHPEWDEVLEFIIGDDSLNDGEFTLKDGRRFACYSTMYGDGLYLSNTGTQHGVDSGTIGCIRVDDIRDTTYMKLDRLGSIVEFPEPFETWSKEGVIHFAKVSISTANDEDDQDMEDWR